MFPGYIGYYRHGERDSPDTKLIQRMGRGFQNQIIAFSLNRVPDKFLHGKTGKSGKFGFINPFFSANLKINRGIKRYFMASFLQNFPNHPDRRSFAVSASHADNFYFSGWPASTRRDCLSTRGGKTIDKIGQDSLAKMVKIFYFLRNKKLYIHKNLEFPDLAV